MKIVIFGGTGYIGSRLYLYLRQSGHAVRTVDDELCGNVVNSENIRYSQFLKDGLGIKADCVVILSGRSSVAMCDEPYTAFASNVMDFIDILQHFDCPIIYASSSSVYGSTDGIVVDENWPSYQPRNYYDLSKRTIDYIAELQTDRTLFGLRMGTVCGGSPNLRTDLMINKMYHDAKTKGTISISNPKVSRPILGMIDFCRAVQTIIDSGLAAPGIYNLASFNTSVGTLASQVSELTGAPIRDLGPSQTYDFKIDTAKFCANHPFQFSDSVRSIVEDLDQFYPTARKGDRT